MEVIEIKTLIDITNTNVRRINQGTPYQFNQFRNWTTLMQTIGMRSIIDYDKDPECQEIDISQLGFGSNFKGKHRVWVFQFRPDRADAFSKNGNSIELLKEDLDKVPVITNLSETINIKQPVFELKDSKAINTVIRIV